MAKHVIKSDRDTTYSIPLPGTWEFTKSSDIEVTEGYAIDAGNIPKVKMSVAGTAITHDSLAAIHGGGANFSLAVKKGALVSGEIGVDASSNRAHIVNYGTIAGRGTALSVHDETTSYVDTHNYVENRGTIFSSAASNSGVAAVAVLGMGSEFTNSGKIQGSYGLFFEDASSVGTNEKSGKIIGDLIAVNIQGRSGWVGSSPDPVRFVNHGLLDAPTAFSSHGISGARLINDGVIKGQITYSYQDDTLINKNGEIRGNIVMGEGTDTIDTRGGKIIGTITGGDGSDTLKTDNAKYHLVEEINATGIDTVMSTVSYTLSDNVEQLILIGSKNINGTGTGGADTLKGNSGDNVLKGLSGADIIEGGKGNDKLYGGDALDPDRFVFKTGDGKDVIMDFDIENGNLNYTDTLEIGRWKAIKDYDDLISHHVTEVHGNAVIFAGKDSVTLKGVTVDDLKEVYFDFS